jgi:hypothetical protein
VVGKFSFPLSGPWFSSLFPSCLLGSLIRVLSVISGSFLTVARSRPCWTNNLCGLTGWTPDDLCNRHPGPISPIANFPPRDRERLYESRG